MSCTPTKIHRIPKDGVQWRCASCMTQAAVIAQDAALDDAHRLAMASTVTEVNAAQAHTTTVTAEGVPSTTDQADTERLPTASESPEVDSNVMLGADYDIWRMSERSNPHEESRETDDVSSGLETDNQTLHVIYLLTSLANRDIADHMIEKPDRAIVKRLGQEWRRMRAKSITECQARKSPD